jgi:hypothetical protein
MGCDIHICTEKLSEKNDGSKKWVNCDNWRYNEHYNSKNPEGEQKLNIQSIYSGRNYTLFSVLAGVRDYSGESKCISQPKGLPKDISKETKAESKRWGGDGHSHSYLTLKEIKDFRASKHKVKFSGLVSQADAKKLDEGIGTPDSWCQWTSPSLGLVQREWEEEIDVLHTLVKAMDERMRDEFWIWDKEEHPDLDEKIRIVFWFDN